MGEGDSVCSECSLRYLPCVVLRQTMSLPLHSLSTECGGKVLTVKELLWHKHVALRTPGVGAATLLQNHNGIPHVAMRKVDPEVGPD